jgi:hypothetical protein
MAPFSRIRGACFCCILRPEVSSAGISNRFESAVIELAGTGSSHRFQPRGDTRRDKPGDDSKEKDKNMNRIARLPVLAAVLVAMMVSLTGCDRLKARDQLNKGVRGVQGRQYEEAITHFQNAKPWIRNFRLPRRFWPRRSRRMWSRD